jgi:hypothetical protein
MDFSVPLGLGCLMFGLPNVYVGWSNLRGRGTPPQFLSNRVLRYLFAPETFPPVMRPSGWFGGVMQLGYGSAFAAVGLVLIVSGFAQPFA